VKNAFVCLVGSCVLLNAFPTRAQESDRIAANDRGPVTTVRAEFPFKTLSGFLIVVEGRLGSLSKLKFILDTGVTRSIVDRRIADRLKVARKADRLFAFDRVVGTESATFSDVQIGSIHMLNVSMQIASLAHISTFASDVDAVVGSDLLSRAPFTIDYEEKRVRFNSLQLHEPAEASDSNLLTVELQVQDQLVRLLVDTGFPDILLFEDRVRRNVPALRLEHIVDGFRLGGRRHVKKAILPRTHLRDKDADVEVLLVQAPPDNILPGVDGLLGLASLRARRVDFDYARHSVAWK
jgi:predicted aspartyl protease